MTKAYHRGLRAASAAALGIAATLVSMPVQAQQEAKLAIPGRNMLFLSQYIANDEHLWQKQGLDVKVLYINGIGSMNAVISGSADFSMSSGPSIVRANVRGQKLTALLTAINQSGQSIVVRKEVADAAHFDPKAPLSVRGKILKGHIFAIGAAGAIPDIILKVVAKDAGMAPNDVTTAAMQPPEFMAAFAAKKIDGFSNSPPFIEQVLLDGSGVLVSDARIGEPKEYSPVSAALLLARSDFCPAHQDICTKMVHGIFEATQIIRNDPQTSLKAMKAHFGTYSDKVLEAAYQTVRAMTDAKPVTTVEDLANGDNLNAAAGFIKPEEKFHDYKSIIDNQYVK